MSKTLKYALSAVLGIAIVTPTLAQQFPDVVPPEHWAYDAVLRLKEAGLLVGYPDGKYRGPRNATRYEMAVAIHATWDFLKKMADAHEARIKALEDGRGQGFDPSAINAAIKALQDDVAMIKRWRSEIDELNRLAKAFERDLAALGVDVAAMKKDITDLQTRVGILEKVKPAVDLHGDVNFVSIAGYSDDPEFGIGVDGKMLGVGAPFSSYAGDPVGMDKDFQVFNDFALTMTGTNDTGPKWGGTIAMTTMFDSWAFTDQSQLAGSGEPWEDEAAQEWYIQDLWVSFPTSIGGLGFNATAGRFGHSISPYIFMRPDNTPYYVNERWDNGKWMMDGAMVGFNFGGAKLSAFLGRTDDRHGSNFTDIQVIHVGQNGIGFTPSGDRPRGFDTGYLFNDVDRVLGAQLNVPITQNGSLNLAYIWLMSDEIAAGVGPGAEPANGVIVWGGDIRFNLGGPTLEAGYSQSDVVYNSHRVIDEDNASWFAKLGWNQDRWGVNVGYRMIEPQFAAPGWWGRIGIWWNPTDIQGFMADAHFDLTDMIRLTASGAWYTGTETTIGGATGLLDDDELRHYMIGVAYKINNSWDFGLGYERVEWDLEARLAPAFPGGTPTETWWNIGFGYTLSNNVGLKLLWQISDYDSKGTPGFNPFSALAATRARGGMGMAQLSVKF